MQYFVGIDCGLSGGIVVLNDSGQITQSMVMPTVKMGKGNTVDIQSLVNWFDELDTPEITMGVEDPGKHAASAMGLWSMTRSFTIIETLAVAYGIRYDTYLSQKWQKKFWSKPKMAKGKKYDTKSAALLAATKLWPTQDWTATERSSKAHDGLVDAALIAEYIRRELR